MANSIKDIPLGVYPKQSCHKCGKRYWDHTMDSKTWSCLYCGNLIYFSYGAFKQQIDFLMESSRHSDYVKTPCGTRIVPKTSETLKKIRFNRKVSQAETECS